MLRDLWFLKEHAGFGGQDKEWVAEVMQKVGTSAKS